jgi:PEP-CTERM motif-containing protein
VGLGGASIPKFDTRSFDPISLATISINGFSPAQPFGDVNFFAFDVVTPEPTTLLLWGAGAAGLGLARRRRRLSRCQ